MTLHLAYARPDAASLLAALTAEYAQLVPAGDMPVACHYHGAGLHDTYMLQTDLGQDGASRYVFRLYRTPWREPAAIAYELEALQALREHGAAVAGPLPNRHGELSVKLAVARRSRIGALFEYAPGTPARGGLAPQQARRLGASVAHMHSVADGLTLHRTRPPLDWQQLVETPLAAVQTRLLAVCDETQARQHIHTLNASATVCAVHLQALCAALPQAAPYYGLCAGDIHGGNAHFDTGCVTLFDFDQCGPGWRAFELAKFIHTAHSSGPAASAPDVIDAFLAGYELHRRLSPAERDSLPWLRWVAHLWVTGIHLANLDYLGHGRLDRYWLLRQLEHFPALPEQTD